MCNLYWCYTFCSGVTLEVNCSQPVRIECLFFMYMIIKDGTPSRYRLYYFVLLALILNARASATYSPTTATTSVTTAATATANASQQLLLLLSLS